MQRCDVEGRNTGGNDIGGISQAEQSTYAGKEREKEHHVAIGQNDGSLDHLNQYANTGIGVVVSFGRRVIRLSTIPLHGTFELDSALSREVTLEGGGDALHIVPVMFDILGPTIFHFRDDPPWAKDIFQQLPEDWEEGGHATIILSSQKCLAKNFEPKGPISRIAATFRSLRLIIADAPLDEVDLCESLMLGRWDHLYHAGGGFRTFTEMKKAFELLFADKGAVPREIVLLDDVEVDSPGSAHRYKHGYNVKEAFTRIAKKHKRDVRFLSREEYLDIRAEELDSDDLDFFRKKEEVRAEMRRRRVRNKVKGKSLLGDRKIFE